MYHSFGCPSKRGPSPHLKSVLGAVPQGLAEVVLQGPGGVPGRRVCRSAAGRQSGLPPLQPHLPRLATQRLGGVRASAWEWPLSYSTKKTGDTYWTLYCLASQWGTHSQNLSLTSFIEAKRLKYDKRLMWRNKQITSTINNIAWKDTQTNRKEGLCLQKTLKCLMRKKQKEALNC